jgi:5,10-methylene-tetrahydrofolate dehydrogenase/methenyl tetrahydrofolate cyclohydrolase
MKKCKRNFRLKIKFSSQIKSAEIVVAGLGKPKFIQGSWLKENAVVIDCGITSVQSMRKFTSKISIVFCSSLS